MQPCNVPGLFDDEKFFLSELPFGYWEYTGKGDWVSSEFGVIFCNSDTMDICGWSGGAIWGRAKRFCQMEQWAWATVSEVCCGKSLFCDGCFLSQGKKTVMVVAE